jgi:TonB family protein
VHLFNEPGLMRPTLLQQVKPRYTPAAMRANVQGTVGLSAVVEADGSVGPVRVTRSLDQELDAQAIDAAKQWRFTPGTIDGAAVRVLVTIDLSFRLRDGPPAAPVLSWPEAFPPAPVSIANEDSWKVDVEHADNLEYHIAMPSDWTSIPGAGLATLVSADRRLLLTVGKPRVFSGTIDDPLSPEQLLTFGQTISRPTATGLNTRLAAVGQVRTPNSLWMWFEVPMTPDDAALGRLLGGAPRSYDGATQWEFAATVGGHLVQVGCGVLRQHGESDANFTVAKRDGSAVCARIMDRMTITAR